MFARTFLCMSFAAAIGTSLTAHAQKDLVPVETRKGHPELFISPASVHRDGSTVSFTYVLGTATGYNSMDAVIDRVARTVVTDGLRVYPETLPEGAVRKL